MTEAKPGQLRGIGLRLDPQEILIAPHDIDGVKWGYTILDDSTPPAMFIDGEWKEFIPAGVWIQMLQNWADIKKTAKQTFEEYPDYLICPELKALVDN